MTVVQTASINLLTAPPPKLNISLGQTELPSGASQIVGLAGAVSAQFSVRVHFAGGRTIVTKVTTDASGHATLALRVPRDANSAGSQTATVTATSPSGFATSEFSVLRQPVEAYVRHKRISAGKSDILTILGPKNAVVHVQVLYPDHTYSVRSVRLDANGHAADRLVLPPGLALIPGRKVTVQVLVSLPSGLDVAVTDIRLK
jgi:hypothetical protein